MNYKAITFIRGSTGQAFYGKDPDKLIQRATKALTYWKPGEANLWPDRFELWKQVGQISGNRSKWERVSFTTYNEIPASLHEWRKREAERAAKRVNVGRMPLAVPVLPIAKVREAVGLLLERSAGPTNATFNGNTYVLVRLVDFAALEHYYKFADWK